VSLGRKITVEPEGLIKLVPPFWGKPRMASILVTLLEAVQGLHDQIWSVIDRWDVDTAPYLTLEWMAQIVGETSRPPTADGLRTLIKGRILANRSSGTMADLAELAAALFAAVAGAQEDRLSVALFLTDPGVSDPDYAVGLFDEAAAGTVATAVITQGTLGWYDATAAVPDVLPGFYDEAIGPDGSEGTLGDRHS